MSPNVNKLLAEATKATALRGNYRTSIGDLVEYGSKEHVDDLERVLVDLVSLRNQQPRSSSSRFAYAKAIEILKSQLRKARRHYDLFNVAVLDEKEE